MALTGIYNSSDREMVLTPFQAQVFNQTIQYFKTNGVGGDNVFEDTYVLQKSVAEYIKENVTTGGGTAVSFVNQIYNGVLGITPVAPPPPPPEPIQPAPPQPMGGTDSYTPSDGDSLSVGDSIVDDRISSDAVFTIDDSVSSDAVFTIDDSVSSVGDSLSEVTTVSTPVAGLAAATSNNTPTPRRGFSTTRRRPSIPRSRR